MTLAAARTLTRLLVIGTPLAWIAWDVLVVLAFGHEATISHLMWSTYQAWKPFALLVGLAGMTLFVHFFIGW